MMPKRKLTPVEISMILRVIPLGKFGTVEANRSVRKEIQRRLRKDLETSEIYPRLIPKLMRSIRRDYRTSKVTPGEAVGILNAQANGSAQTQMTLNSVDYEELIPVLYPDGMKPVKIGEFIDNLLQEDPGNIQNIPKNRTEYLPTEKLGMKIPSCDENGMCGWWKIEAVTRHLPVGKLVKVTTESGRVVTATQSKSFLVWDGAKFAATEGSKVKVGDLLPTTCVLPRPELKTTHFDVSTVLSKREHLYTTEVKKALALREKTRLANAHMSRIPGTWWKEGQGKQFTLPYSRADAFLDKRKAFMESCEAGFVVPKIHAPVSSIPEFLPLTEDFGYVIGAYLADGWSAPRIKPTFLGFSKNDKKIRDRVDSYFASFGVTSHLVTSKGKNVRKGESNDLKIHSALFARIFLAICGTGSSEKRVPEFAYTAPMEFQRGLLDGYISGDGSVNKSDGAVKTSSASEQLTLDISFLLSYFGIIGKFGVFQLKKNNIGSKHIKPLYTLDIRNDFAKALARQLPLTSDYKQDSLCAVTMAKSYRHPRGLSQKGMPDDRNVIFDAVKSVEHVDGTTEFVYDLTVERTRNFNLYNSLCLRDTFHKAGQLHAMTIQGVPRFGELLNATHHPKTRTMFVDFEEPCTSLHEVRELSASMVETKIGDVTTRYQLFETVPEEDWYSLFELTFSDKFRGYSSCVRCYLDMSKMYARRLTVTSLVEKVEEAFEDIACVVAPLKEGLLDIFFNFAQDEDNTESYFSDTLQPTIAQVHLCGITDIKNVFVDSKEDGTWALVTEGSNFKGLAAHPGVDFSTLLSNDMWEIYENLGVEAAREFLIDEYMSVVSGDGTYINERHVMLLVDIMTQAGTINSISRYGMERTKVGPLAKVSFEESVDNFMKAGEYTEQEHLRGCSASIMCGKPTRVGTGISSLLMGEQSEFV